MSEDKTGKQDCAGPVQVDEPGVAKIKPEFLLLGYKPVLDESYVSDKVKDQLKHTEDKRKNAEDGAEVNEPPAKKVKLKGRNKKRPKEKRIDASEKICPAIVRDEVCSYGDSCKFSHDRAKFMATKPPDISNKCYMFDTYGKCPFGLACRFGSTHITEDLRNMVADKFDRTKITSAVKNILKKDNQVLLWKRKYDFTAANRVIDEMGCRNPKEKQNSKNGKKDQEKASDSGLDAKNDLKDTEISNKDVNVTEVNSATSVTGNDHTDISSSACDKNASRICEDSNSNCVQNDKHVNTSVAVIEEKLLTGIKTEGTDDQNVKTDSSVDQAGLENDSKLQELQSSKSGLQSDMQVNATKDTSTNQAASSKDITIGNKDISPGSGSISVMCDDEGIICLRPQEKKKVNFADKLYLAPLTTVGNLPFRRICKRLGADITCGEMAVATNLLQGQASEWALLKRHDSEDLFGVQVCGAYADTMTRCAQIINDTLDVDFVDINCGCPIDLIFNKGEGSALMGRVSKFEQIVKGMTSVLDVPLTVKVRTGIYSDKNIAHNLMPKLRDWGVALTTIHGRSRVQRYTKTADWDYISECAKLAAPMPVFGNGDILSFVEANERQKETDVSGIMIARGALIKPWIFTEIKEQRHWDISANERFDILRDYTNYGLEHWGSDQQGVESTRRFLLEWLSFLYRYIPVGLLERLPQKINERPPYYKGRNDLETLMASPNCGDWIKISEMLLGPVPEGFSFLPKHKANAYK